MIILCQNIRQKDLYLGMSPKPEKQILGKGVVKRAVSVSDMEPLIYYTRSV